MFLVTSADRWGMKSWDFTYYFHIQIQRDLLIFNSIKCKSSGFSCRLKLNHLRKLCTYVTPDEYIIYRKSGLILDCVGVLCDSDLKHETYHQWEAEASLWSSGLSVVTGIVPKTRSLIRALSVPDTFISYRYFFTLHTTHLFDLLLFK